MLTHQIVCQLLPADRVSPGGPGISRPKEKPSGARQDTARGRAEKILSLPQGNGADAFAGNETETDPNHTEE